MKYPFIFCGVYVLFKIFCFGVDQLRKYHAEQSHYKIMYAIAHVSDFAAVVINFFQFWQIKKMCNEQIQLVKPG